MPDVKHKNLKVKIQDYIKKNPDATLQTILKDLKLSSEGFVQKVLEQMIEEKFVSVKNSKYVSDKPVA